MIRVLIVEDEPLARLTIRDFLKPETWVETVGEAADGHEAVQLINQLRPDLIFLDIKMPGLDGIQVLNRVRHEGEVIFTTAYDNHAVKAFELGALDYILKPFGHARFHQSLLRVRSRLIARSEAGFGGKQEAHADAPSYLQRLFIKDRQGRVTRVAVDDIIRLVGADDFAEVFVSHTSYLVHLTLSEFERQLDPARFRRVHRSVIVNLDKVVSCIPVDRRLRLKLTDGAEVIASRAGSRNFRNDFV